MLLVKTQHHLLLMLIFSIIQISEVTACVLNWFYHVFRGRDVYDKVRLVSLLNYIVHILCDYFMIIIWLFGNKARDIVFFLQHAQFLTDKK